VIRRALTIAAVASITGSIVWLVNSDTLDRLVAQNKEAITLNEKPPTEPKEKVTEKREPTTKPTKRQPEGKAEEKESQGPEQPKDKPSEKKKAPTKPKEEENPVKPKEKEEPGPAQPKDQPTGKAKAPSEPTEEATEKKNDRGDIRGGVDFAKVDYTYAFSRSDYTKGPNGQALVEQKREHRQQEKGKPIPGLLEPVLDGVWREGKLQGQQQKGSVHQNGKHIRPASEPMAVVRLVERGYYIEKKMTAEEITDSYRRLLVSDLKVRYPKAAAIHNRLVKALYTKKTISQLPPLPSTPLRPEITDFRHLVKKEEAVVITKQQRAILLLVDGRQASGDLHSLDSKEVQFKPAGRKGDLTTFEPSKVKAVQTESDTYFYSAEKRGLSA
jgi:hypothetical protein